MMKSIILSILLALTSTFTSWGEDFFSRGILKGTDYYGYLGYEVGGTMPASMPATIRKVTAFRPRPNLLVGFEVEKSLGSNAGLMLGLQFENKGMSVDAKVKNYHTAVERGGESLEGQFTGYVNTTVTQWMFTVPLMATYAVNKVHLKAGPFLSYLTSTDFHGWAYNGYLRVGDPTGPKVEMGESESERGDYDFSDRMRRWQTGVGVGADWHISHHIGAFVNLTWSFSGIFKSGFHVVEQTLHPLYGQVGVTYRLR